MIENYNKKKMLETLVNPDVSIILAELENGEKDSEYLSEKLKISSNDIKNRLSYIVEHGFVIVRQKENKIFFKADMKKLNDIMEHDENFSGVIDGLTELDQFLN